MQRANYQRDYMSVLIFNKIMIRLVGLKHLLNKKYNRITRNLSQVLCIDEFNVFSISVHTYLVLNIIF
jgi:predicted ATPase